MKARELGAYKQADFFVSLFLVDNLMASLLPDLGPSLQSVTG